MTMKTPENAPHGLRTVVSSAALLTLLCAPSAAHAAPEAAEPASAPPVTEDSSGQEQDAVETEAADGSEPASEDPQGATPTAASTPLPAVGPAPATAAEAEASQQPASPTIAPVHADATQPPTEPTGTDWPFVGGIIAVAGGVGLLVAGHYGMFRLEEVVREDEMRTYREGVPEGESACARARSGFVSPAEGAAAPGEIADRCDEADSMEILRYVALPIGAAVTVVGLLLIGTSDTVNAPPQMEQARGWRLQLGAGPQGGGATATLRF